MSKKKVNGSKEKKKKGVNTCTNVQYIKKGARWNKVNKCKQCKKRRKVKYVSTH